MKNIKELLQGEETALICGASNAMIAKLAENAGFDGIWLSSFELHAWNRFPDASILNVADYADAISKMSDRVDIPILFDADEGGPSAINTIRMAREYSKSGAWGMCIEDNPSPKRCSFYGMKKEMEKIPTMVGKIRAAIEKNNKEFEEKVEWGLDLSTEHERYLVEEHFKLPTIVKDYPKEIKSFYMKENEDNKTVASIDMLVPGIGELIGGSMREDNYNILVSKMNDKMKKDLSWYLDLRRYGTVPHGGFGLGFERLVLLTTGMKNIRDVIPYPRYPKHCNQ